jgi:hypothetical protein
MIERARAVADAILYEGFLLFPYAKSALKNQMPFQFGVVMPRGYADPTEPAFLRSQFVVCSPPAKQARMNGVLRFLQLAPDPIEREVPFVFELASNEASFPFAQDALQGEVHLAAAALESGVWLVTLEIRNRTQTQSDRRNDALLQAFISAHVLLEAREGEFVSLLDPPAHAAQAVARCTNDRAFPVLLADGAHSAGQSAQLLLVSPIILYDFPRIAAASRTRTFDGTEIDELLMLSVASLTDEEKTQARAAHSYVRELVERADALDAETQRTLHGELTGGAPARGDERVVVNGMSIGPGSRVRVQPKRRADIWDEIVRGMTGRVNAVHTDFEGRRYVGVVFDADPASDMHEWYGRSFFYGADEVEPVP